MKVLLTGAGGFIGSQVARQLVESGDHVVAMLRPGESTARLDDVLGSLEVRTLDLADTAAVTAMVADTRPEACVHPAWNAEPGKYLHSRENLRLVEATHRLAEALADHGCRRLVGVGTNAEYDTSYGYLSERTPTAPTYLYSACKLGLSHSLAQLGLLTGMQVAWARLFYLYGPWEDPRRLVSSVTRSLLEGREAPCSAGLQVRDFLHVSDVAGGLVAVLRSGVTGAVNVGSGEPVTVREVVTRLGAMIGRPELLRLGAIEPKAGEPAFVCADNAKLRAETGWKAAYTLDSGLADTVAWWRSRMR
jgi:nucleoside-diphosphate-sugar epimerase